MTTDTPADVFISHAGQDREKPSFKAFIERLEREGIAYWDYKNVIDPGAELEKKITQAISDCIVVVFLFSYATHDSEYIGLESSITRKEGKAVLPLRLEPVGVKSLLGSMEMPRVEYDDLFGEGLDLDRTLDAVVRKLYEFGVRPGRNRVGYRYHIQTPCVHRGEHADLFRAEDMQQPRSSRSPMLVHVLRHEKAQHAEFRNWFERRLKCWKELTHGHVLAPHATSDPGSERPAPFLVVDYLPACRSLESLVQREGPLSGVRLLGTLRTVAQVCSAAHRENLRLLTLPLRHLLLDGSDQLWLTGFDTITKAAKRPLLSMDYWKRLSRDCRDMAPQVDEGAQVLPETVDVFALGVLLELLRRRPREKWRMAELAGPLRREPWECFTYHCLAEDPNLRFQSAEHFLEFLDEWTSRGADAVPPVVEVPTGKADLCIDGQTRSEKQPMFWMGKYPVTNFEYEQFCCDKSNFGGGSYRLPYREGRARLCGPWCPVVGVSLLDAQAYCRWLSQKTGARWRVPRESEWLRAAVLDRPCGREAEKVAEYPWGQSVPTARLANYGPFYRGPTVVGAWPEGASATGCRDMAGNVWEWCTDFLSDAEPRHVLKGGAYDFSAPDLRVSTRHGAIVTCRSPHVGFRVLCEEKP